MENVKLYYVRFLIADRAMDLYNYEIGEFADGCGGNNVMYLNILEMPVYAPDMISAEKIASKRLYDSWKGDNFEVIGITY